MDGCLEAYISPCLAKESADDAALSDLLLPLAVTIRNLSAVFCADRVILTGDLIRHLERFRSPLQELLACYAPFVPVEFLANSGSAALGAASIAADLAIKELRL